MKKSRKPVDESRPASAEDDLWAHAMRDVRQLPGRRTAPRANPPAKPMAATKKPAAPVPRAPAPAPRKALPELTPGQMPGVDGRTAMRLKRGEMDVETRLDLHGMTQEQAHAALMRVIGRAHADGVRCVLVITGKGGRGEPGKGTGVLRAQVPKWLNGPELRPAVLAFTPARPRDGGEGALYVLLKRTRPKR